MFREWLPKWQKSGKMKSSFILPSIGNELPERSSGVEEGTVRGNFFKKFKCLEYTRPPASFEPQRLPKVCTWSSDGSHKAQVLDELDLRDKALRKSLQWRSERSPDDALGAAGRADSFGPPVVQADGTEAKGKRLGTRREKRQRRTSLLDKDHQRIPPDTEGPLEVPVGMPRRNGNGAS